MSGADESGHDSGSLVVLFMFLTLFLGSILRHIAISNKIPCPYTVMLLILGGVWGLAGNHLGIAGTSIDHVTNISPALLLQIFLPALIFESAFSTNSHLMSRGFGQALLLAGPGILIATGLTAMLVKFAFTTYGWNWYTSLMFGAMVSATDPVAVVALLRDVGASKRLATLIEAESMLNDGTAFVLFIILNKAVATGSISAVSAISTFVRLSIGGPLLGVLVGIFCVYWLNRVYNDSRLETAVTISAAYLTFWIAELPSVHVSSVLAVVFLGTFLARNRTSISPEIEKSMHHVWEMIAFVANTIIFVLSGAIVASHMVRDHVGVIDFLYLGLLYIMLHVIRAIAVFVLWPLLYRQGYGLTKADATILVFGGLRGAVGLALGLFTMMETGIEQMVRDRVMFHVSGIVLLTLLINATSMRYVLHWLGLDKPKPASLLVFNQALRHLKHEASVLTQTLKQDKHFAGADWARLRKRLPRFENLMYNSISSSQSESKDSWQNETSGASTVVLVQNMHQPIMEVETELRLRFLSAMKAAYWQQFEEGMTSKNAVRALVKATDVAMDNNSIAEIFDTISPEFGLPWWLNRLYELMPGSSFFNHLLYRQLSFAVELGTAFLEAAQRIDKVVLGFPELSAVAACDKVQQEMRAEVQRAQEAWLNVQILYPGVYRTILTRHAAEYILHRERDTTRKLYRQGLLDDKEKSHLITILDMRLRDLSATIPLAKSSVSTNSFLRSISFLSGLHSDQIKRVERQAQPRIYSPGQALYEVGEKADSIILIRSGIVNLIVNDETVNVLSSGAALGTWALRTHASFLATAKAGTLVEALVLEKSFMLDLCKQEPNVSDELWKMAAATLLKTFFRERFLALTVRQLGELANEGSVTLPESKKFTVENTTVLVRGKANGTRAPLLLLPGSTPLTLSSKAVMVVLPITAIATRHAHEHKDGQDLWIRANKPHLLTQFHCGAHVPLNNFEQIESNNTEQDSDNDDSEAKNSPSSSVRILKSAKLTKLRHQLVNGKGENRNSTDETANPDAQTTNPGYAGRNSALGTETTNDDDATQLRSMSGIPLDQDKFEPGSQNAQQEV